MIIGIIILLVVAITVFSVTKRSAKSIQNSPPHKEESNEDLMRGEHIGNPPSISNVVAKDGAMKWVSTSWPSLIIKEMSKGEMGEWQVHNILTQLPEEYTLFDDVVLKTSNGTVQIDHVVVSKYGVFAIETKNYRGEIYGDDNRQDWTQIIVTNVNYRKKWWKTYSYVTKNHFYNPVKQSLSHIKIIKKTLVDWPHLNVVPIVVFTGSAVLNGVTSQFPVIYENQLLATIQKFQMQCISDAEVVRVVNRLINKNIREQVDDRTHIGNVYSAKQSFSNKVVSGVCPHCGGTLVLRNGRYGSFYGCTNYPRCKFTTH